MRAVVIQQAKNNSNQVPQDDQEVSMRVRTRPQERGERHRVMNQFKSVIKLDVMVFEQRHER